jgi:L-lysine exporter family protein LysE/ArgO
MTTATTLSELVAGSSLGTVYLLGLASCAGLIIAIGAQNAFVLRQGLRREHVAATVTVCALSDVALISIGTAGIGWLSTLLPWAVPALTLAGVIFLLCYGLQAAKRAWNPENAGLDGVQGGQPLSRSAVIWRAAAFSWLNPHAWLDTTVLIGSLANTHGPGRNWVFALGAMSASLIWFTLLAWSAGRLAPVFRAPSAWRVLDAGIAVMMLGLAGGLSRQMLHG